MTEDPNQHDPSDDTSEDSAADDEEAVVPRTPPTLKERRQHAESAAAVSGGLLLCGLVATFVFMYNGSPIAIPSAGATALLASLSTYFFRKSLALGREEREGGAG